MQVAIAHKDFEDWSTLLELLQNAFSYMDPRIDPPSSLKRIGITELRLKAQNESLIIAIDNTDLVGCAFATVKSDCVYVGKLAVAEHARGRGIARKIMEIAESIARENDRYCLELQTRVELIENHNIFTTLGFEKVAESAHPGYSRPTSIIMRKRLSQSSVQLPG